MASTSHSLFPSIYDAETLMPVPGQRVEQTQTRSTESQKCQSASVPSLERQLVEWTIVYCDNELDVVTRQEKKKRNAKESLEKWGKDPADFIVAQQAWNEDSKFVGDIRQKPGVKESKDAYQELQKVSKKCRSRFRTHPIQGSKSKGLERQTRVCNWVQESSLVDQESTHFRTPRIPYVSTAATFKDLWQPGSHVAGRSFHENTEQEHVKKLRERIDFKLRQDKLASKLVFDNTDCQRLLSEANEVICELQAKLERRDKYMQSRRKKDVALVDMTETVKRERDGKLGEYKALIKNMNEVLAGRETDIDSWEKEKRGAEGLYQRELQREYQLSKRIEVKEKQIETLRVKMLKAKKWKDEARQ